MHLYMITYICGITYANLPLVRYESCFRIKFRSWFYTFFTFNYQPGRIIFFLNLHLPSSGNYKNTRMIMNDYINNDYINILFMQYEICIWYLQKRNAGACMYIIVIVSYHINYIVIYINIVKPNHEISEMRYLILQYIFSYSL